MSSDNDIAIEAWNSVLFDKFSRFKHLLIEGLSAHSEAALVRHAPQVGMRVLDVGCGFGDTTLRLARMVGARGSAVGVDCAPRFVAEAEREAAASGQRNVSFFAADVQSDDLRGPYDGAFARFGTMFFAMPGAAMRNVRKALRPGARFTQVVWRRREENPWLFDAEQCVRALVPVVAHEDTDAVHCGPGPFSMSGPDMVSSMLIAAGFRNVCFERFDADICIGRDLEDAVAFAMALGPAGEIMRLAGDVAEAKRPEVMQALRETFARRVRSDGVWAPSSTWIVTAENAG